MKKILFALTLLFLFVTVASAADYIGTLKCRSCHKSTKSGGQYKIWAKGAHAGAFETLASDEAKAIAAEQGIADAQTDPGCLSCHATGYGHGGYEVMPEDFWTFDKEDKEAKKAVKRMSGLQAVGCEACHGPGSDYKKKKTMKAITAGEMDGASVGLWEITEETCTACHNEKSPTFQGFDYEEKLKEVAHPIPPREVE